MSANIFQAWVAKKMGDNTGEEDGFLSLDPLNHIDPLGLLFIVATGIGWGKHVRVNPFNIVGVHHRLRIFIAVCSDLIAYMGVAIVSMVMLLICNKDLRLLYHIAHVHGQNVSIDAFMNILDKQQQVAALTYFPFLTSVCASVELILSSIIGISITLAIIYFFTDTLDTLIIIVAEETQNDTLLRYCNSSNRLLVLLMLFLIFSMFVFDYFYSVLFHFVQRSGIVIVHWLGIV